MSLVGLLIMSQQLLKMFTLCPYTCMKTATPLVNCFVNVWSMSCQTCSKFCFSCRYYLPVTDHLLFTKNIWYKLEMKQWVSKQNKLKLLVCFNWWLVSLNFHLPVESGTFYTQNISQNSVVTHLRYVVIFSNHFTANLLTSLPVKEFWKSVKIWWSYCYEFVVFLFGGHGIFHI